MAIDAPDVKPYMGRVRIAVSGHILYKRGLERGCLPRTGSVNGYHSSSVFIFGFQQSIEIRLMNLCGAV